MKKIYTLIFAITLFASSTFAQCGTITAATQTNGNDRINLAFANFTDRDAFLANIGGSGSTVTANPGGPAIISPFGNGPNLRILFPTLTGGAGNYNGEITFNDAISPFTCTFGSGALPVSLTSFIGKNMEKFIQLEWKTASELNNDYFTVERSIDGRNFEQLAEVTGRGTTTETVAYAFKDEQPASATNYYRLRQVDYDGTESFSNIITVNFKNTSSDLKLYPTLVQAEVNLDLTSYKDENVVITILNTTGKIVFSKVVNSNEIVTLNLDNLNLGQGFYYVHCQLFNQMLVEEFFVLK